MGENRVNFRDVDRPLNEYPKGTEFVHDRCEVSIPLPSKEELEEYKKKKNTTSQ